MINRIKLALKIIFGYNIIIYEENSKIVKAIINGNLDILENKIDYVLDKGHNYAKSNGEIRYLR